MFGDSGASLNEVKSSPLERCTAAGITGAADIKEYMYWAVLAYRNEQADLQRGARIKAKNPTKEPAQSSA
jgi:hypothetical protein